MRHPAHAIGQQRPCACPALRAAAVTVVAALIVGCAATPPRAPPELTPAAAADVLLVAMSYIDTPYRRGGNAADTGFDCSGFTRHVYERSLGLALPRTAAEQARSPMLREVPAGALQAGDLVFFNTLQRPFSHVGIYIGEGRFVHAPRPGLAVRTEAMASAYWSARFEGARRALQGAPG